MSTLSVILLSASLHAAAFWLLIRHMRAERRRVRPLPMIGSDPRLTATLHARLCRRQPDLDWLNPHVLRRKVAAFLNRNR